MIYLKKILPIFFLPFGISLMLLLVGCFFRRRWLIGAGIALLWVSSTPLVSAGLLRATEGWAERKPGADAPTRDAIVVLSSGRVVAAGRGAISEWTDADRFYGGVELFQAGRAPLLIFTGGWAPWEASAAPEGEILIRYATALGVPPDRMLTTGRVSDTAGEARAVAALLRARLPPRPRVLLVTSAYHMPRAQRLFERAGLDVTPFPVDFQVSAANTFDVLDFLPSPVALAQTQRALREIYGRLYYRLSPF